MKGTKRYILFLTISLCLLALMAPDAKAEVKEGDVSCLAENIYWEARGEPVLGQVWVAASVLSRVEDPRWPNSVCEVVFQKDQYSWTREERRTPSDKESLQLATEIAIAALEGRIDTPKLNHYLRCDWMERPNTWWWKSMNFVGQIGDHCYFNAPL